MTILYNALSILTDHFKIWLEKVFFPSVGQRSLLLIDSWTGHCPEAAKAATPLGKTLTTKIIPAGTTGKIQPLDVYGFRVWKNYVRHFSDAVLLLNHDLNLHLRNNIIKLQSLVHNQLSSPRYQNLFRYAWFKSNYTNEKPEHFDNPVSFAFGDSSLPKCEIEGCTEVAIVRCSWCKKSLCFKHFFDEYHNCETYKP